MYKIRRKTDGLFSNGGQWPDFSKTGKTWNQEHHLKAHLAQVNKQRINVYENCEIVEYETVEKNAAPVFELLEVLTTEQKERRRLREIENRRYRLEANRREMERLQREMNNLQKEMDNG